MGRKWLDETENRETPPSEECWRRPGESQPTLYRQQPLECSKPWQKDITLRPDAAWLYKGEQLLRSRAFGTHDVVFAPALNIEILIRWQFLHAVKKTRFFDDSKVARSALFRKQYMR